MLYMLHGDPWLQLKNYAQTYKNVVKLLERGFSPGEIAGILSIGLRLVHTYIDIIRQYHPEIVEHNPHLHQRPVSPEPTSPEGHLSQI